MESDGAEQGPSAFEKRRLALKAFCIKHFLPLGLFTALVVSLALPQPGREVASWQHNDFKVFQTFNVCTIFFVSGMTLKTEDVKDALKAVPSLMYGLVAILLITPFIGFLTLEIPFSPREFRIGLTLFACMPTTLTSGVTMVGLAKGNTALALLLTVGSNLLGVATVPFMLKLVLSSGGNVKLDAIALLIKLALTILAPLAIGKALREAWDKVPPFCTRNKVTLGIVNNGSLVLIVWQTCSVSADDILDQSAARILPIIAGGVALHAVYLAFNGAVTEGLSRAQFMPWKERKAVWLLTSQKTLPVAMTVLTYLAEEDVGRHGLIAIPMIVGHMSQLFIDSAISSRWGDWAALEQKADADDAVDNPTFGDPSITTSINQNF